MEFELLRGDRRRYGALVTLLLTGCVSFFLSHVNSSLNCWSDLWRMTEEVFQLSIARAKEQRSPLGLLSVISFSGAILLALLELFRTQTDATENSKGIIKS